MSFFEILVLDRILLHASSFAVLYCTFSTLNNNEKIIKLVLVSELPLVLCSGHLTFNNTPPSPNPKKDIFKLAGKEVGNYPQKSLIS